MIKKFCDVCGKEIEDYEQTYTISFERSEEKYDLPVRWRDVCKDCVENITIYIRNSKKHSEKR